MIKAVVLAILAVGVRRFIDRLLIAEHLPAGLLMIAICYSTILWGARAGIAASVVGHVLLIVTRLPAEFSPGFTEVIGTAFYLSTISATAIIAGTYIKKERERNKKLLKVSRQQLITLRELQIQRDQSLEAERAAVERAARLKDEFLAAVSHELRTPLSAITTGATLLRRLPDLPQQASGWVDIIQNNAKAQADLVDDLLDLFRVGSGQFKLKKRLDSISDVIKKSVATASLMAKNRNICIHSEVPSHLNSVQIFMDSERVLQSLLNLLSNAVKFTDEGGLIKVKAMEAGDQVNIEVSDTGRGIAPEVLPKIFEKFHQADTTSDRRHMGLGIGLSLAKHFIEMHQGTIKAFSAGIGKGATFMVTLPTKSIIQG